MSFYAQDGFRCRFDWGRRGTHSAAERGDILVIVDVLSFSSAVVTAVAHGGLIYPCALSDDVQAIAREAGAEVAVRRKEQGSGRFSLSPLTFQQMNPGERAVLPSPNGATCSRYARSVPYLFAGALLNARAVAGAVSVVLAAQPELNVTVIACGERWDTPSEDGELRYALEDYLGAGAILSELTMHSQSPEARVCAQAFMHVQDELTALLWECGSGRELRAKGFPQDVEHSAQLNTYTVVPVMREGCFCALTSAP